jgi:hypothetical protein
MSLAVPTRGVPDLVNPQVSNIARPGAPGRGKRRPAALENEKTVFHFRTGDGDWMFA